MTAGLEVERFPPDPRLRGYVGSYCVYAERTDAPAVRRELSSGRAVAIVNLGEPIDVMPHAAGEWSEQAEGFFSGLSDSYALTRTRGSQRGVQVDLSPVGAHLLLRVAMRELANRVVTLDELFGAAGTRLWEAVAAAPSAADRCAALDDFFLERLDDGLSPVPTVTRALARLHSSAGAVRVDELAAEIGCSRRHLSERFAEQVGASPKLMARLLRFEHARELGATGTARSWAEIAQDCGYHDQSHLIRDFNQFAGCPPGALAASAGDETPARHAP